MLDIAGKEKIKGFLVCADEYISKQGKKGNNMTGIKRIEINGLEQYQVIIRGCVHSTHWSKEYAKAECLRIVNKTKRLSA